jgi:hypothetical protein
MPALSINNLDQLRTIQLNAALVRGKLDLTEERMLFKMKIALHEGAHLCAAIACPQSFIHSVSVRPTGKGLRGIAGDVRSDENYPDEESFVSLVGCAWEEQPGGDTSIAVNDYERGYDPNYPEVMDIAHEFVREHGTVIRYAAVGALSLCNAKGVLANRRLKALRQWLKPQIKPFRSRFHVPGLGFAGNPKERKAWAVGAGPMTTSLWSYFGAA